MCRKSHFQGFSHEISPIPIKQCTDISIIDCTICVVIYDDTTIQYLHQDSVDLMCVQKDFDYFSECSLTDILVFEHRFWKTLPQRPPKISEFVKYSNKFIIHPLMTNVNTSFLICMLRKNVSVNIGHFGETHG